MLAHFLLFTVKGVPCIYYGDEIKVEGLKEEGQAHVHARVSIGYIYI